MSATYFGFADGLLALLVPIAAYAASNLLSGGQSPFGKYFQSSVRRASTVDALRKDELESFLREDASNAPLQGINLERLVLENALLRRDLLATYARVRALKPLTRKLTNEIEGEVDIRQLRESIDQLSKSIEETITQRPG